MDFPQKNDFIIAHQDAKHNFRDIELLQRRLPFHPILRERINEFNARSINGKTLMALLNSGATPTEILDNRSGDSKPRENRTNVPTNDEPTSKEPDTDSVPGTTYETKERARGKKEEFPGIAWDKLDDENIQHAVLMYNDRVETYHRSRELEPQLDAKPELAGLFQELIIRNNQADSELRKFETTGKWLHTHPLGIRKATLDTLKRLNNVQFAKEYASAKQNVSRYQSQINNGKYRDTADRQRIEALVIQHQSKLDLMEELQNTNK